jgi:hypothetical protein
MEPIYFVTVSVDVTVCDGSKCPVRAIQFIQAVAHGGITDAIRNVVMKAIDAGVLDKYGVRVPLSPDNKGGRAAVPAIAKALQHGNSALSEPHAKSLAKKVLKDLTNVGCVVAIDVPIPQYRPNGRPNGYQDGRGLVARWELAPWHHAAAAQPPQTGAAQQQAVDEAERSPDGATASAAQQPASTEPDGPAPPADEPINTSEQAVVAANAADADEVGAAAEPAVE